MDCQTRVTLVALGLTVAVGAGCQDSRPPPSANVTDGAAATPDGGNESERITFESVEGGDSGSFDPSSLCQLLERTPGGHVGAYEVTQLYSEPNVEPYVIHAPLRRIRDLSGNAPAEVHFTVSGGPDPSGDGTSIHPSNELVAGETAIFFLAAPFEEVNGTDRYKATQEQILRDPEGDGTYTNEPGLFAANGGGATVDEVESAVETALTQLDENGTCTDDVYPRNWQPPPSADSGVNADSPDAGT